MSDEPKVRVSVEVQELVTYHRYVEMDRASYDRLDAALGHESRKIREKAEQEISDMMDRRAHVTDAGDVEVTGWQILK